MDTWLVGVLLAVVAVVAGAAWLLLGASPRKSGVGASGLNDDGSGAVAATVAATTAASAACVPVDSSSSSSSSSC